MKVALPCDVPSENAYVVEVCAAVAEVVVWAVMGCAMGWLSILLCCGHICNFMYEFL